MKTKRLKAFTLLELTIAMLISAVCIGMAFYMFQYFQQLLIGQQRQRSERFAYTLFQKLIREDMDRAQAIRLQDGSLTMEDTLGTVVYRFEPDFILRNQYELQTDTFFFQPLDIQPIPGQDALPQSDLVEQLRIGLRWNNTDQQIELRKRYSAEELLKLEE